jgi:phage gp45-like
MPAEPAEVTPLTTAEEQVVPLRGDRTLTLLPAGRDDLVEIRAGDGQLQLRVRLTDEGPILEMDSVRLQLRAQESVDVECKDFNVNAERQVGLSSEGGITVDGKADVTVTAEGEVRVTGEMIWLN